MDEDCDQLKRQQFTEAATDEEEASVQNGMMRNATKSVGMSRYRPVAMMLDPGFHKPLLVGVGLMVAQQFSGISAVLAYTNSIFAIAASNNGSTPALASEDMNTTSFAGDVEGNALEVDGEAHNTKDLTKYFGTISVLTTQLLVSIVAAGVVDK
jgi:hypothetical protein